MRRGAAGPASPPRTRPMVLQGTARASLPERRDPHIALGGRLGVRDPPIVARYANAFADYLATDGEERPDRACVNVHDSDAVVAANDERRLSASQAGAAQVVACPSSAATRENALVANV